MQSFLPKYALSTVAAIALHVVIGLALIFSVRFSSSPRAAAGSVAPIEAVMIDEAAVQQQIDRIAERERAAIAKQEEAEQRAIDEAEAARAAQQRELQRLAEIERTRQQAETEEADRKVALQRQREQEDREQVVRDAAAAEERERLAELQREREALEARRAEDERRQREDEARVARERAAEEERQRLIAAEEARIQGEFDQQLADAIAAEKADNNAREAGLLDQYIRDIENQIQQRWIRPPTASAGLECVVNVTQIPSGDVTSVSIGRCNGDDAVIRSIEAAVLRASPLPRPSVPSLFNRNLVITFRPDN
jgi:colicin import membrane protein